MKLLRRLAIAEVIDRLLRHALRRGLRDGLLAGDGLWITLGAVAWLARFLMKRSEREVVREELREGETIVVTNLGPGRVRRAPTAT